MLTKKILILLLASSLFAEVKGPIEKAYKYKYENLEGYKAMYVAVDFDDGRWAYGYTYNQINESEAEKAAKKYCEKEKKRHDINGYCKLYAIGNRVLGF